jgi:hypothetical protein
MMNGKEKTAFRRSKKWLDFRAQEIKRRGLKCELLGMKLYRKTAQLHHLKPSEYDLLIPENFKLLSPFSHQLVEFLAPLLRGNTTKVPRIELLLAWIGEFLPEPERTVEKYYKMMKGEKE